jgi:opacity protein-like surface antigen
MRTRSRLLAVTSTALVLANPVFAESGTALPPLFPNSPELTFAAPGANSTSTLSSQSRPPFGGTVDWTGFYGGLQAGIGITDTNRSGSDEDVIGGFTLGYDHEFGQWVLGGGLDYDFADIDAGPNNSLEEIFRVKARGGYKIGRGLLYGTGGYAVANTETAGTDDGWFIGGGYEYMVSDQFSVGTEALYHEFDSFNNSGTDIDTTTIQVRAIYRF